MPYHLVKSPAKFSDVVEHTATNCGGGGDGQELMGGTSDTSSAGLLHQSMNLKQANAELDRFTGWVTEVTWVVFMFSFSLAVGVLLVLWCCSRKRGGDYQDAEEHNHLYRKRSLDNGYLLGSPVTLYKSNEKLAEDRSGVLNKEEGNHGEGKGDM